MRKFFLWISPLLFILAAIGWFSQIDNLWKISLITAFSSLAIGIGHSKLLSGYQYTCWIITAVCAGLIYPQTFLHIGEVDLRNKWLILIIIQLVMFGMGTQMSIEDFTGIRKSGKGVLIGLLGHFYHHAYHWFHFGKKLPFRTGNCSRNYFNWFLQQWLSI